MDRSGFLKRLEKEHRAIKDIFDELIVAADAGPGADAAAIKERLDSLESLLVAHVNTEDELFYADMKKRASELHQDALLPALDIFMRSMHDISGRAIGFFHRFSTAAHISANRGAFASELKALRDEVIKRIESEEGSIFYIYKAYFLD